MLQILRDPLLSGNRRGSGSGSEIGEGGVDRGDLPILEDHPTLVGGLAPAAHKRHGAVATDPGPGPELVSHLGGVEGQAGHRQHALLVGDGHLELGLEDVERLGQRGGVRRRPVQVLHRHGIDLAEERVPDRADAVVRHHRHEPVDLEPRRPVLTQLDPEEELVTVLGGAATEAESLLAARQPDALRAGLTVLVHEQPTEAGRAGAAVAEDARVRLSVELGTQLTLESLAGSDLHHVCILTRR